MNLYIRAVTVLSRLAGVVGALLIAFAVLVICDMVIERYILGLTTIWQIDVVTYCIMAATFVGSAYVLMTRGHVNVDVLPLHLGERARCWLALITILIAISFCTVLFVLCTIYWYQAWSKGWHSDTVWRARPGGSPLAVPGRLRVFVLQYVSRLAGLPAPGPPPLGPRDGTVPPCTPPPTAPPFSSRDSS